MLRSNHSPGPWKVSTYTMPDRGFLKAVIETTQGKEIAEIILYPRQRAPKANAQFISAAPDMFHALMCLSAILDEQKVGSEIWGLMQKAIDKAIK